MPVEFISGPFANIPGFSYSVAPEGDRLLLIDSLSRDRYVTAYAVSLVHVALGQTDSALAWLDQAVKERTHWLVWLNRDDRWEPIRHDPDNWEPNEGGLSYL